MDTRFFQAIMDMNRIRWLGVIVPVVGIMATVIVILLGLWKKGRGGSSRRY